MWVLQHDAGGGRETTVSFGMALKGNYIISKELLFSNTLYISSRAALSCLVGKFSNTLAIGLSENDTALSSFLFLYSFGEQFARKFLLLCRLVLK